MPENVNHLRLVQNVLNFVRHSPDAKHREIEGGELSLQLKQLRAWQSKRIARTYADFAKNPRYALGLEFFLGDLYAPRDFSQRDHDIEHAHELLSRLVPAPLLQMLTQSIRLNRLTHELDHALLKVLVAELGMRDALTGGMYTEAYHRCDNYPARVEQIRLIGEVLRQADDAIRFPITGAALKLARVPVEKAGWNEMYAFLVRGYEAFKQMRGAKEFIAAVETREMALLDRIFAGEKNPFE